ncbi:radical SAM/SPASM domain-containing protein [Elusimicrobiota bacterium]
MINNSIEDKQEIYLQSTPQYITIGTHFKCNADCVFCLGGDYPEFNIDIYKNFFEKKLGDVLRNAQHVGFCGMGEILLMPGIASFLDHINSTLEHQIKNFTTNGSPLKDDVCNKLGEGKYAVMVSLHASNAELHKLLTNTDKYDSIIDSIRKLVEIKKKKNPILHINLVFLVSNMNVEDLPEFVKVGKQLDVDRITCNYLTIFSEDHIDMSCYFHKEKTREIFEESQELAEKLEITLNLPPKFGNADDNANRCNDPWEFFYVETQGSVVPCCYAGDHIGYLNKKSFEEIWNGEGYLNLRKGFIDGNPYKWCKYCTKYKLLNVDKIQSHITARPEIREKIIGYLKCNEDKYGKIPEIY